MKRAPSSQGQQSLGSVAARGAFVTLSGQGTRLILQLVSIIVLGRLLLPTDYGLIAMVMAIVGIGDVLRDFGLSSAAIQAKKLTHPQRDNLFWANTTIGLVLFAVVALTAPLVARFYDQPRLTSITHVLAVTFLLNGLATQYRADLNRRLLFSRLAVCDVLAQLVGLGVGVAVALMGGGYWALVGMQLALAITALISVVAAGRWLPRRPRRGADMGQFLSFGWHLMGTQLVGYVSNNLDSLVIGQRFGAQSLGLYNRAFSLLMQPLTQVRAPTTTVALPVLARLQDDERRYGVFLLRGQVALGYTLVAGVAFAAGAAEPLIDLALGSQWRSVAPLFTVLAVAGGMQTLAYVGYWVFLSRALTRELLTFTLVSAVVRGVCIFAGSYWGVLGVAVGYAVGPTLLWPVSLLRLSQLAPIPLRGLLMGALRILVNGVLAGTASWLAVTASADTHDLVRIAAGGGASLAVYALMTLLVPSVRRDVVGVADICRRVIERKPLETVAGV